MSILQTQTSISAKRLCSVNTDCHSPSLGAGLHPKAPLVSFPASSTLHSADPALLLHPADAVTFVTEAHSDGVSATEVRCYIATRAPFTALLPSEIGMSPMRAARLTDSGTFGMTGQVSCANLNSLHSILPVTTVADSLDIAPNTESSIVISASKDGLPAIILECADEAPKLAPAIIESPPVKCLKARTRSKSSPLRDVTNRARRDEDIADLVSRPPRVPPLRVNPIRCQPVVASRDSPSAFDSIRGLPPSDRAASLPRRRLPGARTPLTPTIFENDDLRERSTSQQNQRYHTIAHSALSHLDFEEQPSWTLGDELTRTLLFLDENRIAAPQASALDRANVKCHAKKSPFHVSWHNVKRVAGKVGRQARKFGQQTAEVGLTARWAWPLRKSVV